MENECHLKAFIWQTYMLIMLSKSTILKKSRTQWMQLFTIMRYSFRKINRGEDRQQPKPYLLRFL